MCCETHVRSRTCPELYRDDRGNVPAVRQVAEDGEHHDAGKHGRERVADTNDEGVSVAVVGKLGNETKTYGQTG